jgi:hypothetical protein
VDERTKLEDEKRHSAELKASIGQLQSNVETLEQALSQSNDCLKVHVAHVYTQQTMNDDLKEQVKELQSSLESARSELDDKKREIADQQDAAMGVDLKVKELEQILQSTKDCLAIEKCLSNVGQASTAALTVKVQELENLVNDARQKIRTGNDRHVARQQDLERSLDLSNNGLEAYMDRCNSQQASIDTLSQEAQHLTNSLGAAQEALEVERQQSAIRQASVEELRTSAKELEISLHLTSDCLQDEKSRCNMHQASVSSLRSNVRTLEQSLHQANMDIETHKRQNQEYIVSTEANVLELEKTLDLNREDLVGQTMHCIAQAADIVDLNNQIQDLEKGNQVIYGDLNRSKERCNAQELSIITLDKLKQELEKSLHASRDNLEAKAQLYDSQQPYIDRLKDTEKELQRSLQASQKEIEAEKERCIAQQSLVVEMESELRELRVELESTRARAERAEQLCNTQYDGISELNLNAQPLEDGVDRNAAGMDLPDEDTMPYGNGERQLAQATARTCPALLESEMAYNLMVIRTILRHISPCDGFHASLVSDNGLDSESGGGATGVPTRFLGINYPQSYADSEQDHVSDGSERRHRACRGDCVGMYGSGKSCLSNTQFSEISEMVGREAVRLHGKYDKPWPLEDLNHKSPEWLRSTMRADYPGASDEKTLAGLSLIEQHVRSLFKVCCGPRDPKKGLKVIKERAALYRSEWYLAAGAENKPTSENNPPRANTARKRHNNDDLEVDTQRQTKRRPGTPTAHTLDISDTGQRQSNVAKETEAEMQEHDRTASNNVNNTPLTYDSNTAKKLACLEQIRLSPWAHDTSESAQHFIESLTPALCVNVLSRLVELSKFYSAQQVVLHIDLEQLHRVGGKRGASIISPIVESGFTIAEKHISRFPKLSFDLARLDKLLRYRLDCASFGPAVDEKTLGLKPSGLFTLVSRQDPLATARNLRKCFDTETIASIRAAATTQAATTKSHENEEATHPGGRLEIAPDQDAPDIQARLGLGDQNDGRSKGPTHQAPSNQVNRLRGQIQTDVTSIAVESRGGGGGSERAKANDQINDDTKDSPDKIFDTGRLRNAAGASKVRRKTRSKMKDGSSQDTAGANGRPKRTPKPSRRAAEAASAK